MTARRRISGRNWRHTGHSYTRASTHKRTPREPALELPTSHCPLSACVEIVDHLLAEEAKRTPKSGKATTLRPYDSRMWCAMGQCFETLERTADAIRAYERACGTADRDPLTYHKLATLYLQLGNKAKAAEHYQNHISEDEQEQLADTPQTQDARLFLAKWFKDQEQWQEAEQHTRNLNPTTETAQVISEIRRRQAEAAAIGNQ